MKGEVYAPEEVPVMSAARPVVPHRRVVRQLSAAADVDARTATRALTFGIEAIHGDKVREALREGAAQLGIDLPTSDPSKPQSAA